MKILVVDDSRTIRRVVSHVLRQLGYDLIIEAEDGLQGLNKARESNFDLIITDWNMPKMSGIEMARNIRQQNIATPILMVTANGTSEDLIKASEAGISLFISKPMTLEKLGEKIREATKLSPPPHLWQTKGKHLSIQNGVSA